MAKSMGKKGTLCGPNIIDIFIHILLLILSLLFCTHYYHFTCVCVCVCAKMIQNGLQLVEKVSHVNYYYNNLF
jgi:hypothetical protein